MATSSFAVAAQRNRRRARMLLVNLEDALEERADKILSTAHKLSGGRVSQIVFDTPYGEGTNFTNRPNPVKLNVNMHGYGYGLGHPYGRGPIGSLGQRGPIPNGGAAVVNFQSGDFYFHWFYEIEFNSYSQTILMMNDSAHAKYMDGTPLMVKRPICEEMLRLERKGFIDAMRSVLHKTWERN